MTAPKKMVPGPSTFSRILPRKWPLRRIGPIFGLLLGGVLYADTLQIVGGGRLSGPSKVVEASDDYVMVKVDDTMTVAIDQSHVRRRIEDAELADYAELLTATGEQADAQFELGRWCRGRGLVAQSRFHYRRAMAADPDHKLARAALGYVRTGGQWIQFDELRRKQGLVNEGGRWTLPEAVEAEAAAKADDVASKRWIKDLARLRARAIRGDADAIAEIAAITDPLSANAIASELKATGQPRAMRMTWVRLLGSFRSGASVRALVETGLLEEDDVVREEALRQLQQHGASSAVASYLPLLRSNNPGQVQQAARALAFFPDPELADEYISALVTWQTIRQQVGSPGGMTATFGDTPGGGGGGLSTGSKVREQRRRIDQPAVVSLLRAVLPEVNFGYNQAAWSEYLRSLRSPPVDDLRRDP